MKENKGMTLVALVVTIIIMLILAGIAINAFIGDHGLFSRAKDATNKYKEAENNETREIDKMTEVAFDNAPQFIDDGTVLEWTSINMKIKAIATDDDGDKLTYTLNFGETEELGKKFTIEKGAGEKVIFDVTDLTRNVTYYYKIEVTDGKKTTEGRLLSKKTIDNGLPKFEDEGTPKDITVNSMKITTMATDGDEDELTYTINWGITESLGEKQTITKAQGEEAIFEFNNLERGTTYYWQVEVFDGMESKKGHVYSETTIANSAPQFTNIGTVSSTNGSSLTITASATDANSDPIEYILNWGTTESLGTTSKSNTGSFSKTGLGGAKYYYRVDVSDGYGGYTQGTLKTATRCTESFSETRTCSKLVETMVYDWGCGGKIVSVESIISTGNPNAACYWCRANTSTKQIF